MSSKIRKVCWRGERVYFQFPQVLFLSELKGPKNSSITSIKTSGLYNINTNSGPVLDIIAPLPLKGSVRDCWITIDIPSDCIPGDYTNEYAPFVLVVLSFILPPVREWKFHLDLWQNPWSVARLNNCEPWSELHFKCLERHLLTLADAGQKVITATLVDNAWNGQTYDKHGSMVKWIAGQENLTNELSFDFSILEKYVDVCRRSGIYGPIHCFSLLPWGSNLGYGAAEYIIHFNGERKVVVATAGDNIYELIWSQFINAFCSFIREKDWIEDVYFAFDGRNQTEMIVALSMLHKYLPSDFHPPRTASAYEYNPSYTDYITDLSPMFNPRINWNEISNNRRGKGQKTTFYLCECPNHSVSNTFLNSPLHECVWVGWYAFANGLDGFLHWVYDSWPENPFLNGEFPGPNGGWQAGYTFLSYPQGLSSRRLALLREGIQDYEKMRILIELGDDYRTRLSEIIEPFIHADVISLEMMKTAKTRLNEFN